MTEERAIELVKWGPIYAKPSPKPGEYMKALEFIAKRPDLHAQVKQSNG